MRKEERERRNLEKDLLFYLRYYRRVSFRSERIRAEFEYEIDRLVELLKELE